MSKIRSANTKPEIRLRRALWAAGVRFRVNDKQLPGKPDISIKKYHIAIFVDGEFWHGYNWEDKRLKINSNREYWLRKIERNIERDIAVNERLAKCKFAVFRFWTKEVERELGICVKKVIDYIDQRKQYRIR